MKKLRLFDDMVTATRGRGPVPLSEEGVTHLCFNDQMRNAPQAAARLSVYDRTKTPATRDNAAIGCQNGVLKPLIVTPEASRVMPGDSGILHEPRLPPDYGNERRSP